MPKSRSATWRPFFPSSPYFDQARYWRARCLEAQQSDDQAQLLYRELFGESDEKIAVQAGLHLAEMAHDREDYVAAMREYRATLAAFPKSAVRAQLWLRLGEALMALEDPARLDEALAAFDEVLQADPSADSKVSLPGSTAAVRSTLWARRTRP